MSNPTDVKTVPILSGEEWQVLDTARYTDVYNPSTGKVIARTPLAATEQTAEVVDAAASALPAWSETPVVDRARVMFRLRVLMEQHFEELAALITREHGKTLAEARAEVQSGRRDGGIRQRAFQAC